MPSVLRRTSSAFFGGWFRTGDMGDLDVVFRQALPRNPSGKILKRVLREELKLT